MRTKIFILIWIISNLLCTTTGFAQVGNCERGLGEAELNVANVRARIPNNGGLFWRGSPHVYEVPKGSGNHAIFAADILVGGWINSELRTAASRYGPWEFWPGPLDDQGYPPADCSIYDKVWEINRNDIAAYINTGTVTDNLAQWPWHLGAPVLDADGVANNYNLEDGDLPELFGDQRLWWVMNDRGNIHEASGSEPIGLEIHASAHALIHQNVKNHTFYQYRIINKNSAPLEEAYFGLYIDPDLGNFDDDYVGSDSLLHMSFVYNSDNFDEGGEGYQNNPPAVGITILDSIVADQDGRDNDRDNEIDERDEMLGLAAVMVHYGGGGVAGDPVTASDYYNYMLGRWKNGESIVKGGSGYTSGWMWPHARKRKNTSFSFSGDPVTRSFWSEMNADSLGGPFPIGDRTYVMSTGPFEIASFDTAEVRFAVVWSQGADHLDSVTQLKKDVKVVRQANEALFTATNRLITAEPSEPPPSYVLGFKQNYPNPFSQFTSLSYSLPQTMQVRLAVFDLLGREVALLVDERQEAGIYNLEFNPGSLSSGIYLARIELDHLQFTKRMVLIR